MASSSPQRSLSLFPHSLNSPAALPLPLRTASLLPFLPTLLRLQRSIDHNLASLSPFRRQVSQVHPRTITLSSGSIRSTHTLPTNFNCHLFHCSGHRELRTLIIKPLISTAAPILTTSIELKFSDREIHTSYSLARTCNFGCASPKILY